MAQLHLVPNPTVLVVQAGFFLTILVTVKRLLLEPYLSVRSKRQAMTTGSQDGAKQIIRQNAEKTEEIQTAIKTASAEAQTLSQSILQAANLEKDKLIQEAEAAAKQVTKKMSDEIKAELQQEQVKVPGIVAKLADTMFQQAIN